MKQRSHENPDAVLIESMVQTFGSRSLARIALVNGRKMEAAQAEAERLRVRILEIAERQTDANRTWRAEVEGLRAEVARLEGWKRALLSRSAGKDPA